MLGDETGDRATPLRRYLAIARRRKWIIVQSVVLVPTAALALSFAQEQRFEASAEVLLSRQNLGALVTGTNDPAATLQPDRLAETQASLARVPTVAASTLRAAGVEGRSPRDFLDDSSVEARPNADLLVFRVTDRNADRAVRLATEYGRQFTIYRQTLDTAALRRARNELGDQLRELREGGQRGSALYAALVEKDQELQTLEALQTSNALLVRAADTARQVQPRPLRNVAIALVLGLLLGIALAFLWEALDTRLRTGEEAAATLGLPILARIPEPPRKLRSRDGLVMLDDPSGISAEAFRVLRTNLEFMRIGSAPRTIMVTSAIEREGKSTTVANLAVALARAGKSVALVDLDLRRPYLDRFFGTNGLGLTEVALGHVPLASALTPVKLRAADGEDGRASAAAPVLGSLHVVPAGPLPPNPGEFVASRALDEILLALREEVDVVLVDSPPLLHVGDALVLSAKVDGIILVTRIDVVRRPMLKEVHRLLESVPAERLGLVLTGVPAGEDYGYAYSYTRSEGRQRQVVR